MENGVLFKLVFICFFVISCSKKEFKKEALIGIWSIDSVYCNDQFSEGLFYSNAIVFDENNIDFPSTIDETFLKSKTYCKKEKWNFYYTDTLGYFFTFSSNCATLDTGYVKFINDENIRQLRFELKLSNAVYYGRKGLTYYPNEKDFFEKLESHSKKINLEDIHPEVEIENKDTFNRFTQ
jgi:hypothetical protein